MRAEQDARVLAMHRRIADVRAASPAYRPPPELPPAPADGPGTELEGLIDSLGLKKKEGCRNCRKLADAMNRWGVAGCLEHREAILSQLRKAQQKLGWLEAMRAGANAVRAGLVLNPLDPAPGLFDEAIRRAALKAHPADCR